MIRINFARWPTNYCYETKQSFVTNEDWKEFTNRKWICFLLKHKLNTSLTHDFTDVRDDFVETMAMRVFPPDTSKSEVILSFEELKKLGVHESYIELILESRHDQDTRFKEYFVHVLEAASGLNKEQLIYGILSVFPKEYLRSVCKDKKCEVHDRGLNEEKAEEDMGSISNQTGIISESEIKTSDLSTCSESSETTLVLTDDSEDEMPCNEPSTSGTFSETNVGTSFKNDYGPFIHEQKEFKSITPSARIRVVPAVKVPIWSMYAPQSSEHVSKKYKFIFYASCSYFHNCN